MTSPPPLDRFHAAALLVCAVTFYGAVHWGSTVAGGADSYGYVSEAGLLRQGRFEVEQELARVSPWPAALDTWTPLGFREARGRPDAIVPLYPPGLPLLMALFQTVGGYCAAFLVVPMCGALAVWLTYVLGVRSFGVGSIALAAAVLVAASPVFLYQLMNPMTDVPVTAAWAAATLLAFGGRALTSGLVASIAILIRPNLAPLAVVLAVWLAGGRIGARRRAAATGVLEFLIGAAPGVAIVAILNTRLYGAPWLAGYGAPGELYAARYAPTNLLQFSAWLLETETPLIALAVVPLVWRGRAESSGRPGAATLFAAMCAGVLACYLFYLPFDAWWYLRFLLPMWPMLMLLAAAAPDRLLGKRRAASVALALIVTVVAVNGVRVAIVRSAFDLGRGERRYADVARFIRDRTEPEAIAIALQHSGSIRLYGGRTTLRYDQLDPRWLDRAVAFLGGIGRHPYIVVEGGELDDFRRRFAGANAAGRLDWKPMATLAGASVAIFDAADRASVAEPLAITTTGRRAGWRCERPYVWPPPLRMK